MSLSYIFFPLPGQEGGQGDGRPPEADQNPASHLRGNMASTLDVTDRKLLNILQSSFPLVEEPFVQIGRGLDIPASDAIKRVQVLKDTNVVRQISAIFDTRRLGYKTVLVAMRFYPDKLDAGARTINEHPGVSHNYAGTDTSTFGSRWRCHPARAWKIP